MLTSITCSGGVAKVMPGKKKWACPGRATQCINCLKPDEEDILMLIVNISRVFSQT